MTFRNPFSEEGTWYKANLHTHTTESDGVLTPAERVEAYRNNGYSILAITDHNKVVDTSGFSSEDFLVINGIECHPCYGEKLLHIIGLDVPLDFKFAESEDHVSLMQRLSSASGAVIVAHPYWLGLTTEDLMRFNSYIGIEVYNSTCGRFGKPESHVLWDHLLERDVKCIATAVDDAHHETEDVFDGWVCFKLKELRVEAAMEALRSGCFYSSTGPEIEDIKLDNGTVKVQCSPVASITVFAQTWYGKRFFAGEDKTITSIEHKLNGEEKYLRIECTDAAGKTAWSNPVYMK